MFKVEVDINKVQWATEEACISIKAITQELSPDQQILIKKNEGLHGTLTFEDNATN